jgi:hypothetical protein
MIVVASHNRIDCLDSIIKNLLNINTNNHKILIVDTGSDNINYLKYFNECKSKYSNIIFERIENKCWHFGAFFHAYQSYKTEDKFIFLQDSLTIVNSNLILEWDSLLNEFDVVPWANFGYWHQNEEARAYTEDDLPNSDKPTDSIFGPIFGINKSSLDKIPKEWIKPITNRVEGCAMERRLSLMFHILKLKKHYIDYEEGDFAVHNIKRNINKQFFERI